MRKFVLVAASLAMAIPSAAALAADAPAAATSVKYSTTESTIGELLADPAATAVLEKHLPGFSTHEQIEMAKSMTLRAVQQFSPEQFSDELLDKIDADLAALPAAK